MGKKDEFDGFEAIGNIADLVNNAIRTGDYSSLNRQITEALNEAADAVHEGLTGAVLGDKPFFRTEGGKSYRAESSSSYMDAQAKARHTQTYRDTAATLLGGDGVVGTVPSAIRTTVGGFFTFIFGILFLGSIAVGPGEGMWLMTLFLGAMTAFSGWNLFKGIKQIGRIRRARKILKMLGDRDTITIEEIASAFGKDKKWVADDIQAMIRDSIFTGKTYMDKEETAFMTSHEAYDQYLATMAEYRRRKREERAAAKKQKSVFPESELKEYRKMEEGIAAREKSEARKMERLDKETREMVEEGQAFIAHIHQKNEEVPGEPFTSKLNRLEEIVTGIFDRVAEAPESAPDLHRLMKYYLPTTQKLVDTYATLDRQTVKGENIENAKREIEDSLDTINEAFERFLDSFFQATAWDVSSDISVMGQMMAQDGLTGGNEFRKAAEQKKAAAAAAAQASDTAGEAGPQAEQPGDVQAQPAQAAQAAPAGYTDGYTEGYTEGYAASGAAVAAAPAAAAAEEEKN